MATSSHKTKEEDKVIVAACKLSDRFAKAEGTRPGKEKAREYGRAEASIGDVRNAVQQYRAAGGEH